MGGISLLGTVRQLRIAATGFVEAGAGSIAGAAAFLLRGLVESGAKVDFFSKSAFVDPRPAVGSKAGFRFFDIDNGWANGAGSRLPAGPLRFLGNRADAATYNAAIVRRMRESHARQPYDLALWLGDYARGRLPGVPVVSFVQGPPGTDARSIIRHAAMIRELAGPVAAAKWTLLARLRLSRWGLPPFANTDLFIVGSGQSQGTLASHFGIPAASVVTMPYPVQGAAVPRRAKSPGEPLACLWLGRIVPRKRLDLFLDGIAAAIRKGLNLRANVVGRFAMVGELERLLARFPYPDRLHWREAVPHSEVRGLFETNDILIQPSEEEDFGSSVAEAQLAGLPVIVGPTNGNRDYLRRGDLCMQDSTVEALERAIRGVAEGLSSWDRVTASKEAEGFFSPEKVLSQFSSYLLRLGRA